MASGYLDEEHQTLFHDLMINETFGLTLGTVIDQEAAKAGKTSIAAAFKNLVRYATSAMSVSKLSPSVSGSQRTAYGLHATTTMGRHVFSLATNAIFWAITSEGGLTSNTDRPFPNASITSWAI